MVRVRTAPSPTGVPHIGNTWAALFNYIFARKNKGKFIVRLEDTDRERLVPGSAEKIFETFKWLGVAYDEGPDIGGPYAPYTQSERLDIYKKLADQLVSEGKAYEDEGAIRFKTNKEGKTSWLDLVGNKEIEFDNSTQEDFVILKKDSYPTYNFANVIDDHLMEITHTIRGNEFISSTPKHLMLYRAFGWTPPEFAHLPVLVGADRSKLSKRHGAKSVLEFRDEGYLKEALINFMASLGWTPPSGKEILSIEQIIEEFDFKDFNLASPYFDVAKLEWMNGEYIRKMSDPELTKRLAEFLKGEITVEQIAPTIPLVKERIKKLSDYMEIAGFFFAEPELDSPLAEQDKRHLEVAVPVVESSDWTVESLQQNFLKVVEENNFKTGDFFMSLRLAICGSHITPPIVESIIILGKEKTLERIKKVI